MLPGAVVGAGCNIGDHAYIEGGARLGDRVTVKNAVLVWDKVTVDDDVFLGPNVVFTNDLRPRSFGSKDPASFVPTHVRTGATIGANATIVCGVTVGDARVRRRRRRRPPGRAAPRPRRRQPRPPRRLGVPVRPADSTPTWRAAAASATSRPARPSAGLRRLTCNADGVVEAITTVRTHAWTRARAAS